MARDTKTRALTQAQKEYRNKQRADKKKRDAATKKELAVLKSKGLYQGDLRKVKPSKYHRNLVRTLADVITGKAAAVPINRKAAAAIPKATRQNRGSVRTRNGFAIIPKKSKNERISFDSETGEIKSYVTLYGDKYKRKLFPQKFESVNDLPNPKEGETFYYGLVSKQGGAIRFTSKEEFRKFLSEYKISEQELLPHVEILIPVSKRDKHAAQNLTSRPAPLPKRKKKDRSNTRKSKG